MTTNNYDAALEAFAAYCADRHAAAIAAIYLGGSVARGDHTPGRSDIDLFVVLNERDAAIEHDIAHHAELLGQRHMAALLRFNPEPVSATFTSLGEIDEEASFLGAGFEYHNFVATTRRLYGEDLLPRLPEPDESRAQDIAQFGLNMLHALAQAQDQAQVVPELSAFLFSPIFRSAAIGLATQGVYVGGKRETVDAFAAAYPNLPRMNAALERAYALWQLWGERDLSAEEAVELGQICKDFVGGAYELWCV